MKKQLVPHVKKEDNNSGINLKTNQVSSE
jgi:hypothetical protein